jgi:adenosylmethionine---8-amino-7-oxononanoate aminotransferase
MNLEELDKRVLWHPFTQMGEWDPLVIDRGEGNYLVDGAGRRYLDGVSSLWCNVHGHNHPRLNKALAEQAAKLAHSTFLGLTHEPGIRLAADLVAAAPKGLSRVFYSDSGSTAVEIALKQSFQYWQLVGKPAKQRFLRLGEAYHGDTLGAVGVGGIDLFHRIFGPLLNQSIAVPRPDEDPDHSLAVLEAVLDQQADEIAAFVLEPLVQGAAGMLLQSPAFVPRVAELCRAHGVHLILDEVATGFGRTGSMFACDRLGVTPDFLCLAKGIAGGYLPLAATLATEEIFAAFLGRRAELKHFFHGHTFTGNPLACAVGIESLALLQSETLPNMHAVLPAFTATVDRMAELPLVASTRQCGFMVGIELVSRLDRALAVEVCAAARDFGVILRNLGDVVVWMPPLSLTPADLVLLETATREALFHVERRG